jgi:hypothetical protein
MAESIEFKRKKQAKYSELPCVTSETFLLRNLRPFLTNSTSLQNLPISNTSLEDFGKQPEYTCSTRICLLMNDLYYSPMSYKEKIPQIAKEMKKVVNSDIANSVFISVFQNIKFYVKEIRNILHNKLKKLELLQSENCGNICVKEFHPRRYSADCIYEGEQRSFSNWRSSCMTSEELRGFYGSEEKYIEFLICLFSVYKGFNEVTSRGPEEICHQLLSLCQPNTEVIDYDVHKSLFYDYILKDRIIFVRTLLYTLDHTCQPLQLLP